MLRAASISFGRPRAWILRGRRWPPNSPGRRGVEVTRAARVGGRHRGKNDTRDAEAAARSVLSGQATGEPKNRDGIVESIRVLRNTRASAVKARTQATLHIKNLLITAPDELREPLSTLTTKQLVIRRAGMRRSPRRDALNATRYAD